MTDFKILDSSIWIAYLFNGNFKEIIDIDEQLFLSAVSFFEIKTKLLKKKMEKNEINSKMNFIKKKSIILSIDEKIAEKASEFSVDKNIPAIDSLIYATSIINKIRLITADNDFRNLENAEVLNL